MTALAHMEIAGVNFSIHSREADLLPDPGPCYTTFSDRVNPASDAIEVTLDLKLGIPPDPAGMKRVFDGQAWSLFRAGDTYWFSLAPRGPGLPPSWMAQVDATFTRGIVFCDDILVRESRGAKAVINPILYRLDQLLLMCILASRQGAIFHGAGAVLGGKGYLFAGRSGSGKSTLSRQFVARPDLKGVNLLSDDRVVIRKVGMEFTVFGTPWAGDAQIALNAHAPAAAILFLNHGVENRVVPVSPREAFEKLLPVASVPWYDREKVGEVTSFCDVLTQNVPAYDLCFVPTPGAADFVKEFTGSLL
jgi:hypothetical protein